MPLYLNALTGKGGMLVTTNIIWLEQDASEMSPVYQFLGLTSVCLSEDPRGLDCREKKDLHLGHLYTAGL